jgi:isoleucyl-tRNA synthetase
MDRVPDVIDCWYDSGSASFAQFHYPFENKDEFKKRVPYDFISEAIDQTRGWFYTLHVLSTILFDQAAYKNVICAGHIVDEKGEKMSKSKGNILNPDMVLDTVGVDATRLQFCTMDIGSSKRFGINLVKEEVTPFLNYFWNTYQFYKQINNSDRAKEEIEDRWILSRLNSTIKEATEGLENYQIEKGLDPVMSFMVNDFSKTYIKMIRDRTDKNVQNVCGEILEKTSKLLAPYAPNITDVIYQEFGKTSVHLSEWPKADGKKIYEKLEKEFLSVMKIIEVGMAKRDEAKIGLKWPLKSAEIKCPEKISRDSEEIIMRQLNVKEISITKGEDIEITLDTRMTPELEAEGYSRELSRKIQVMRKNAGLQKGQEINLAIRCEKDLLKNLGNYSDFLKERTNSRKFELTDKELKGFERVAEEKIREKTFSIGFCVL